MFWIRPLWRGAGRIHCTDRHERTRIAGQDRLTAAGVDPDRPIAHKIRGIVLTRPALVIDAARPWPTREREKSRAEQKGSGAP
ncbi:hypothetical protein McPS_26910 [Marichromatium sp. PS1]